LDRRRRLTKLPIMSETATTAPGADSPAAAEPERTGDDDRAPRQSSGLALEVVTAVVIGLAGLTAAWADFQGSLWEGVQAEDYARANDLRTRASRQSLRADGEQSMELGLFVAWLNAETAGEARLAGFYRDRFPQDFRGPFESWLLLKPLDNASAPPSPFAMPAYRSKARLEADALQRESDSAFKDGQGANKKSDDFGQANLALTTSLALAGIAQVFRKRSVRLGLVAVAAAALVFGILRIAILPTIFLALTPGP
jgi:hypothetical protein